MPTIMVAGEKGGTGKSTIASNLAAYFAREGHDVMLLDADPQGTASKWVERRNEAKITPTIHCTQRAGDIFATARDLSGRYEIQIVDAGGRDSKELRTGMCAADLVYVPLRASQADLETLPHVNELIGLARALNPRLRAFGVVSMGPTNPVVTETQEAKALIAEFPELTLASVVIRDRKIYRDALLQGKGVIECENSSARAEIQLLGQSIVELLGVA